MQFNVVHQDIYHTPQDIYQPYNLSIVILRGNTFNHCSSSLELQLLTATHDMSVLWLILLSGRRKGSYHSMFMSIYILYMDSVLYILYIVIALEAIYMSSLI